MWPGATVPVGEMPLGKEGRGTDPHQVPQAWGTLTRKTNPHTFGGFLKTRDA